MADYTNKTVYLSDGSSLLLKEEVASGGEAVIYRTARVDQVAKIYKQVPVSNQYQSKLKKLIKVGEELVSIGVKSIIFPTELVKDKTNQVVGFLMGAVEGYTIRELLNEKSDLFQEKVSRQDLIDIGYRICVLTDFLHKNSILIGDVSFNNILYNLETKHLFFIDVDSFLIGDFTSSAYTPGFYPPEFIEENPEEGYTYYSGRKSFVKTREHEFYSLTVLLFHLFCFDFPYLQSCEEAVFKNQVVIDKWSEQEPNKTFSSICFFALSESVRQLFLDVLCKKGRYYHYEKRPTLSVWKNALKKYQEEELPLLVAKNPNYGELIPDEWEISTNTFAIPTPNPSFGPTQTLKRGNSTYIGQLNARGDYHGVGKLTYYSGDIYEGQFSNGKFSGKGKYTFASGGYQEGEFIAGLLTGRGKKVWADGGYYEGEFSRDKRHGWGELTWANGDIYDGDWQNDNRTGKGKYTWSSGAIYEGDWQDNKRAGKGKQTFSNGDVYEGDWQDDKRTGKGKFTWSDGNVYDGDFINGDLTGYGKKYYADTGETKEGLWENGIFQVDKEVVFEKRKSNVVSSTQSFTNHTRKYKNGIYKGQFKAGKRHGQGRMDYSGTELLSYEGEWENDAWSGQGTLLWRDDSCYTGAFSAGHFHGLGKLVSKSGEVQEGVFNYGKFESEKVKTVSEMEKTGKTLILATGVYTGEVLRGSPHGKGKLVYTSGSTYEGEFSLGRRHGYGIYRNKENTLVLNGRWENNYFKEDKGDKKAKKYVKPNSDIKPKSDIKPEFLATNAPKVYPEGKYIGDFFDGKRHGKGKFTFNDGSYWEGDWKDDAFTGQGRHIANHSQYEGQFLNGKYHGHGRKVYVDDSVYEGNWYQGIRHGEGRLTFRDGNYYEGGFSNNKRHGRGSIYNKFGTIIESGSWEYGKKISDRADIKSPKQSSVVDKANVTVLCPCGSGKQFKNCHGLRK